ncbi:MAG: DNA topoisomerase IB [Candidatus Binataceae bacterium]
MATAHMPLNSALAPGEGVDSQLAAKAAHLRYVNDRRPGIAREHGKDGFVYRDANGKIIDDPEQLARIKAIVIPPAWTGVWICPHASGHIQATGRDARGRKQYRYHPRWRAVRDETKYEHLVTFGKALPGIRRRVEADLAKRGLPREKVIAAVVRLLEMTLARIGNPEYARDNHSFGLTTLKNRHIRISRGQIELDFRAKHGIRHHSVVSDRKLARILKNCRDLPGSELFQYLDEAGERHSIDSGDVNDYLREISGCEITAKDFRSWSATNLALLALAALSEDKPTKKGELQVVRQVAQQLGNTPAVCRKCYIHPAVLEGYIDGALQPSLDVVSAGDDPPGMWAIERQLMRFLSGDFAPQHPRGSNKHP